MKINETTNKIERDDREKPKSKKVDVNITQLWTNRGAYLNDPMYKARFMHLGKRYNCGMHKTIIKAKIAIDKQRVLLGMEPLYLKRIEK